MSEDTEHVKSAEHRLKITMFLKAHPGRNRVSDIAANLGINNGAAGQILAAMSRNGLLPEPIKEDGEWQYMGAEEAQNPSKEKRVYRRRLPDPTLSDDDVVSILGVVAVFKKGFIDKEQFLSTIKALVSEKKHGQD